MAIETLHDVLLTPPAPPAQPQGDWWHYSLGWRDLQHELSCPCPKAACGFVESGHEEPRCPKHGTHARQMWNFSPKSGHPSRLCIQYVRPMHPTLRKDAAQLGPQVARLRRHGLYVPIYGPVEHPSLDRDDQDGDEEEGDREAG